MLNSFRHSREGGNPGIYWMPDQIYLITRLILQMVAVFLFTVLGGCPRIAIFSKIKACEKNYRRHMVDIPRIIF